MRRSDQPSRPNVRICCRLSSPKMLAMPTGEHGLARRVNVLGRCYLTGRFSDVHNWPVLDVRRGRTALGKALAQWRAELINDLGGPEAVSTQEVAVVDLAVRT